MVGFTLLHTSNLALPLLLSATLAFLWVAVAVIWLGFAVITKGCLPCRIEWVELVALALAVLSLMCTPGTT
jgi:hypothetical protein